MSVNILNERDYYHAVYGGWLGKNIGGTLGAPVEGKKERLNLDFYPVLQDGPLENDDLDLQLVWLHALEQYGPSLTSRELGREWAEHVFFPFDEYGYALANLRRGLVPPVAGAFNNPFVDCMGSPIRSEIWGMVTPGAPHLAAYYAYQDAVVDHAGGEGVYGEMFFAAIESAVFLEKDRNRLIEIGMAFIPEESRTAKALHDLLGWHQEGKDWLEARELILAHHGRDNFTDAPQNIAFTILGWLYGNSFEDAILKAVNCGYDTDCTAATLGSILGMIMGPDRLPEKWVKPIGDKIVVSPPIKGIPFPKNLDELTRRTMRMGKQVLAAWDIHTLVHPELLTHWSNVDVKANDTVRALWSRKVTTERRLLPEHTVDALGLEMMVDYGCEGPAIARNSRKSLTMTLVNHSCETWTGSLSLDLPACWQGSAEHPMRLKPGESAEFVFDILSSSQVESSYELNAKVTRNHDRSVWNQMKETLYLVPAAEWVLSGPEREAVRSSSGGNRIEWLNAIGTDKAGEYRATTCLHIPKERTIRLIAASNEPISAFLNGKRVIHCPHREELMPAFHRSPESQYAELTLPAGKHELEIAVTHEKGPLQAYVLPVATRKTECPGPYYYYTDILMYL